jgi:putative transposase
MNITISYKAGKYFVSMQVETNNKPKPTDNQVVVGVDLGVNYLVYLSNGEKVEALKPLRRKLVKLRRLQHKLKRCKPNSKNRSKVKLQLSRLHMHITNIRKDIIHKITTYLCSKFKYIVIEDLNVAGMLKNHNLALSIADSSFYEFRRQLDYKSKLFGNIIQLVNRFYPSSKICHKCGVKHDISLSDRTWTCSCGHKHIRDYNASLNLEEEGKRLITESYPGTTLVKASSKRQVITSIKTPVKNVHLNNSSLNHSLGSSFKLNDTNL